MFQYTTETIINSNKGNLFGGKRFGIYGATQEAEITSGATSDDFLVVDGVNTFKLEYIKKIYHTDYRGSSNATATLDLTSAAIPAAGKVVRLTVAIREQGSVRSTIQNAYLHKTKPFHYEIAVPAAADAASVVNALVTLIKRDMALTDFAYFKAAADGTRKKLVLTADDCYIQFADVKLEEVLELEDTNTPLAAKLLGYNVVASPALGSVTIVPGDEGQGTVTRLVKNLRIPTNASINPFAADQGGKPVPGGEYDQYLIEYETPRAHVSGTVVGSVGEVSRTSHVFFIEKNKAKQDWEAALALIPNKASIYKEAGRSAANANLVTSSDVTSNAEMAPVGALKEKSEMGSVE